MVKVCSTEDHLDFESMPKLFFYYHFHLSNSTICSASCFFLWSLKNTFFDFFVYFSFFAISYPVISDEIIQDSKGNCFLMKDDGTFVKLPKPKPGNKYIIKKIKRANKKIKKYF